jgi:isoleucyl-tRNA synthetase
MADLARAPAPSERPEMDRWLLSMLQSLVREVSEQMEGYYLFNVVPPVLGFVDDLTNWYVRRSRRRFWRSRAEDERDKMAAFATLYEVMTAFVTVLAPVLPFISEHIYQDLIARLDSESPRSVHHCPFPQPKDDLIDRDLEKSMAAVREVVRLGHGLRKHHQLKVRRPLKGLTVIAHDPGLRQAVATHEALISEELNVKSLDVVESGQGLVHLSAKPDFRKLGPRLGSRMKDLASAIAALDETQIEHLAAGGGLDLLGTTVTAADLVIEREPAPGNAVAASDGLAVALNLEADPALEAEGMAREFVSRVQQLRREAALAVSDRIAVSWWTPDQRLSDAIESHAAYIKAEVLATELSRLREWSGTEDEVDGVRIGLAVSLSSTGR